MRTCFTLWKLLVLLLLSDIKMTNGIAKVHVCLTLYKQTSISSARSELFINQTQSKKLLKETEGDRRTFAHAKIARHAKEKR